MKSIKIIFFKKKLLFLYFNLFDYVCKIYKNILEDGGSSKYHVWLVKKLMSLAKTE